MTTYYDDLTIDEVMADPMIRTVMRADRVEPRQLESLLRRLSAVSGLQHGGPTFVSLAAAKGASRCTRSHRPAMPCSW